MTAQVYAEARVATMAANTAAGDEPYGLIARGAVAVERGRIAWVGPQTELPGDFDGWPVRTCGGRLLTPALIDCHTHLVFGGNRAREFELRLGGASYEEIARAGGGIASTVADTREASENELLLSALARLEALIAEGVATVEVKSGYGLDLDTELKMLRVARRLAEERSIRVRATFLGAHAVPPEYTDRRDAYLAEVCLPTMEAAAQAGLVDAVDGFCEGIGFSPREIEQVFKRATALGLPVKLHAEQLSNLGGAALAARYGALSADHLEYLDAEGIAAMSRAGTVAVLLPGAFYALGETRRPPVEGLRAAAVPMALATDCNPGSSPLMSLLLMLNMGCTLFRLTPEEALAGVTREAARALGLGGEIGTLEAGKAADMALWDVDHPAELAYWIGANPLTERIFGGRP